MSIKGTSREQRRKRQRRIKQIRTGGLPTLFSAVSMSEPWSAKSAAFVEASRAVNAKHAQDALDAELAGNFALVPCLRLAVPMWIERLAKKPFCVVAGRAHELAEVVAGGSDVLLRASKQGEAARAFNAIAEGLAALSFVPGGVTFLGVHFEADHPEQQP